VCTEAMASGCVPVVSDACTELCRHMTNALVHHVGDVGALTQHISLLADDPQILARLRETGLATVPDINWSAAGRNLVRIYREAIRVHAAEVGVRAGPSVAPAV
jgi:glycosyltransferase involved in cell wall biosynthesis